MILLRRAGVELFGRLGDSGLLVRPLDDAEMFPALAVVGLPKLGALWGNSPYIAR
jgi:hypothetical protein